MKKTIQDKIDAIRSRASKASREMRVASSGRKENSLSESIRNKKEAEDFRLSYEAARHLAQKH